MCMYVCGREVWQGRGVRKSMRRVKEGEGGGVRRGKRCQHELWLGSTSEGGTQQYSMRVRAIQHREEGMGTLS